jgi:hypothetical protein
MIQVGTDYYINFIEFMENPEKTWLEVTARLNVKSPPGPSLLG